MMTEIETLTNYADQLLKFIEMNQCEMHANWKNKMSNHLDTVPYGMSAEDKGLLLQEYTRVTEFINTLKHL
jgi:hypothetical protein